MSSSPNSSLFYPLRRGWLLVALALAGGCFEPSRERAPESRECTACHGSVDREGDDLARAAPPLDLDGKTDPSLPSVGAHDTHLLRTESHVPVACDECHVVPEEMFAPEHVDTELPAEVTFGKLSRHGDRSPEYDRDQGSCNDTYCHQKSDARWTAPRSTEEACGSCHGVPPPPPHPQRNDCESCHGEVTGPDQTFRSAELHVNGTVEVELACDSCHGSGEDGAPPPDIERNRRASFPGVGAHETHLEAASTHAPVDCTECHVVPEEVDDPDHIDDSRPADVRFGSLATSLDSDPAYSHDRLTCSGTYCHLEATPEWTEPRSSEEACGSCHGVPPPPPHPQIEDCSECHGTVMASADEFLAPELHVNGTVEVGELECGSCHGSGELGAPPPDLSGSRDTTDRGAGAHETHLEPSPTHGPMPCAACHTVPDEVDDPGHIDDSRPADVVFGELALAGDASPGYSPENLSCSNTYCHLAAEPIWNEVRSPEQACGTCHGLPPPPPHPPAEDCSECHSTVMASATEFLAPELHVNGTVELGELECSSCHGSGELSAPPPDLEGNTPTTFRGVGAHTRHLEASPTHGPVACAECHTVPEDIDDPGHIDDDRPADVLFGELAALGPASPVYDSSTAACSSTYCHGGAAPAWTDVGSSEQACGTCHGLPPPPPHPQLTGCSRCHGGVVDPDQTFVAPELHVDGTVQVELGCGSCHGQGDASPAPPPDLYGNTAQSAIGVGAHEAHLTGGAASRPLACGQCHLVPDSLDDPGHIDDWDRAEVVLSGPVATLRGGVPVYDPATATCASVYCHQPDDPAASVTPEWTRTGGPLGCTSCHGLPPPPPHPANAACYLCHANIDEGYVILDRELHVNGEVEF